MNTVKVPGPEYVPQPEGQKLCWQQAQTMERCDRVAGHNGAHTWDKCKAPSPRVATFRQT